MPTWLAAILPAGHRRCASLSSARHGAGMPHRRRTCTSARPQRRLEPASTACVDTMQPSLRCPACGATEWETILAWQKKLARDEGSRPPKPPGTQSCNQCTNSTRTPQSAAAPSPATKATLITLPVKPLLLQPWSTATTQTKNNTRASMPRLFSHIACLYRLCLSRCSKVERALVTRLCEVGVGLFRSVE